MNKNKIILEIIILISFCFLGSVDSVRADNGSSELSRKVSEDKISKCVVSSVKPKKNDNTVWNCDCQCDCQGSNKVDDCQTGQIITDPICACCGDCTLENALEIGVNVAGLILKYMGVVALLFFIIGGMMWITSGGAQERITTGKKMITGAVIGIIIIVFAATVVRTVSKIFIQDEQQAGYLEGIGTTTSPPEK